MDHSFTTTSSPDPGTNPSEFAGLQCDFAGLQCEFAGLQCDFAALHPRLPNSKGLEINARSGFINSAGQPINSLRPKQFAWMKNYKRMVLIISSAASTLPFFFPARSCRVGCMSDHTCPFCEPGDRPIILQNDLAMAFYDKYPVAPGHLLIVPLRHFPSWFDATCEEKTAMDQLLTQGRQLLAREFHAASFNLGINVGAAAGQTVMHLHVHLIPRRTGDTPDPRGGVRGVIPGKQRY